MGWVDLRVGMDVLYCIYMRYELRLLLHWGGVYNIICSFVNAEVVLCCTSSAMVVERRIEGDQISTGVVIIDISICTSS